MGISQVAFLSQPAPGKGGGARSEKSGAARGELREAKKSHTYILAACLAETGGRREVDNKSPASRSGSS